MVQGYANPEACSGVCGNAHDPALIRRSDGTYFRFSTNGGVAIHTAPDITGPWTYKGAVLPSGSKISPGNTDVWAPDVTLINGVYYLYYAVSTAFGGQSSAIGLARSSTMDVGSWTDVGSVGIKSDSSKAYNAIDPNLVNADGNYYLSFGSFWHDLYQVKMKGTPTAAAGGAVNIAYDPVDTAEEGAFVFKHGSYYYLFFSKGQCCNLDKSRPATGAEYKIMVCRSSSATGGFVDKSGKSCTSGGGTTFLESHGWVYAPGGQGVYQDRTYGPVVYYHYVDTRIGYADGDKKFGWNKIHFVNDWPVV
ncbi:glycoside hydrolase family 43 protein [Aplosporella prunicola CBS 121167]|uniref:arabinan endo-1,5-alpha-L-arabinosidase n=1 Tax=Aplosporella prunicola CBS 121167 TaxID=1176127 RepID=A0A6A6B5N9_9PEZI|nr:glycoside hydrolase family 43 protein [Aplosporella prunicola CBS 121167]KAF2138287.1 glycoside hydrolase family 43 protein [Aplosporella prunicola CBS 121167]